MNRFGKTMRVQTGENSVLTRRSVYNQRTERFNWDLNRNCCDVFAPIVYEQESMEALDVDNETDKFCLHFVYIPRINHSLDAFKPAFNNHSISSEGNRIPTQLFTLDRHILSLNHTEAAILKGERGCQHLTYITPSVRLTSRTCKNLLLQ